MLNYQLPNLLSFYHAFELRTNRYCRAVTLASEQWLLDSNTNILDEAERKALRGSKIGLWAALCYPTCDAPQLRLVTDFLSLLVYSNARVLYAAVLQQSQWTGDFPAECVGTSGQGALSCLESNVLFKSCVVVLLFILSPIQRIVDEFTASLPVYLV